MSKVKIRKRQELEEKRVLRQKKTEQKVKNKYLITLAYDGSSYGGYAKQKHKNTVQNVLERTLSDYLKTEIKTTEASRTDAKVHALCQKIMFEIDQKLELRKFQTQINENLPKDIIVFNIELVNHDFHCRYDVINKTYEYTITNKLDPRNIQYSWFINKKLNVDLMKKSSQCLVGKHDFATFKAAKATTDTSVRTINYLEINQKDENIIIRINADGFLYNMVRLIVKALIDVGSSSKHPSYMQTLLDMQQKPDNLESAPAQGLCLTEINYQTKR